MLQIVQQVVAAGMGAIVTAFFAQQAGRYENGWFLIDQNSSSL